MNLCANGIKFTDRGQVTLEARLESKGTDRVTIRFFVTDTGIGLESEEVARLFSPFVQADESTTRKYGGTGLGLAISKQLVGMMGGTIGVDSEKGRGSTFWFTAVFEMASRGQQQSSAGPRNYPLGSVKRNVESGPDRAHCGGRR